MGVREGGSLVGLLVGWVDGCVVGGWVAIWVDNLVVGQVIPKDWLTE